MSLSVVFALFGLAISVGFGAIGSALGVGSVASIGAGLLAKEPQKFPQVLALAALPSTQALYGLLYGFIILTRIGLLGGTAQVFNDATGLAILASSIPVGIACLISGAAQGKAAASGMKITTTYLSWYKNLIKSLSIPHLSILHKISDLEQKISSLESELARLQSKLEETREHYAQAKKSEYTRLLSVFTQENTLLKIQEEILELRQKEKQLRVDIESKIDTSLQNFFEKDGLEGLVKKIVDKEKTNKRDVKISVSQNLESKVNNLDSYASIEVVSGDDVLRVQAEDKTYILDKDT